MRPLGYLVLAVLGAALATQVADVVAARKTTFPSRGAGTGTPTAAAHQAGPPNKPTTLTASSLPAAHPSAAAKGLAAAADKKKTKPHRTTAGVGRRPGGADDAWGSGLTAGSGMTDLSRTGLFLTGSTTAVPAPLGGWALSSTNAADSHEAGGADAVAPKSGTGNKIAAKQAAYPFLVAVQKVCGGCQTRHSCGGVLLAPQWVLTVAQCAETHPGEYLVVRAGEAFVWPGGQTPTQKVIEVVWHEAVTSTDDYPRYDLILMRLENPFPFGEFINGINMAPPSYVTDGAVSVVGWSPPGSAQQVEVNVTHASVRPADECAKIASQETLPADSLCVQPVEPLLDRCAYDLGDPVVVEGDGPLLVGLLSRWYQPCAPERPVAVIKISVAYSWIYEKVNPQPVTSRPSPTPHASTTTTTTSSTTTTTTTTEAATPASAPPVPLPWPPLPTAGPTLPALTTPTVPTTSAPTTSTTSTPTTTPATTWPPNCPTCPPYTSSPTTPTPHRPTTDAWPQPTGVFTGTPSPAPAPPTPRPPLGHVKPMTVSSSSASGALTNTSSTSDVALLPGHLESSLSYSLGTAGTEPGRPALSNSVSVGWSNCKDTGGALGMSYALSYSYLGDGAASAASTVNATCLDVNAIQSQGWSISTSGTSAPVSVRAFIAEHLASIPGLPRQPTLKYL